MDNMQEHAEMDPVLQLITGDVIAFFVALVIVVCVSLFFVSEIKLEAIMFIVTDMVRLIRDILSDLVLELSMSELEIAAVIVAFLTGLFLLALAL